MIDGRDDGTWYMRVIDEYADLRHRRVMLRMFLLETAGKENSPSKAERERLEKQMHLMEDLEAILRDRIQADFK